MKSFGETFIYSYIQELVRNLKSALVLAHRSAIEEGLYKRLRDWLFNITVTGFLIWLVTITFVRYYTVWSIPVFGIAEWLLMEIVEEIHKRWTS